MPEGFTELQSQILASNPRLKTTSYPLTHLFPTNPKREDSNCAFPQNDEVAVLVRESADNASVKLPYQDSLTSSFSSAMGDSLYWSQGDNNSTRAFSSSGDCAHGETRETLSRRLQSLETDCAVVSQLYRAHKQRAAETNAAAFRKAYKCNAQRLKEINREKIALEKQLRSLEVSEQSKVASELTRSNSISVQQEANRVFNLSCSPTAAPAVATLPRRRTFQLLSISASATLRLAKLRMRTSLKYPESQNWTAPVLNKKKSGKAINSAHNKPPHEPHLPAFACVPEKLENPQTDATEFEAMETVGGTQTSPRVSSLLNDDCPRHRYESSCLHRTQIQSDLAKRVANVAGLNTSTSDRHVDNTSCSLFADMSSASSCGANTSQSCSIMVPSSKASGVCLRRPFFGEPNEFPIRCICSCISEHTGNCECTEGTEENMEAKDDQPKGKQQLPTLIRGKLPLIAPRKQLRKSLKQFSLFHSQGGKRASFWNR